ncbi:MAG TPA: hypothetical protein VMT20_04100 [Terriglobia bacterium]|nr:hypothetical protein [Terriglobia bacterium]
MKWTITPVMCETRPQLYGWSEGFGEGDIMATKVTERRPSLADAEWTLDEVHEYCKPLEELRKRLVSLPPDSPARLDLLPEIAVAAEVLKAKLTSLIAAVDAVEDELPDDD